jgi:hypothetical protein
MIKDLFLCGISVLTLSFASGQKKGIQFHTFGQVSLVEGEKEMNGALQLVSGIEISRWFAAAGTGVDYYRYNTMPLFFQARRYFGKKGEGFVYGDLGHDFPLKNPAEKEAAFFNGTDFKGGIYTEFGLGFRMKFIDKSVIAFSAGYSYKKLHNFVGYAIDCTGCDPYYFDYRYGFGRWMASAAIGF